MGTAGSSKCSPEHGEVEAPSVPTRPAARAGTQTGSLLGSAKQVHWVARDECKLGLVHRWQAAPAHRTCK